MNASSRVGRLAACMVLGFAVAACDGDTVFVERELFNPPPDQAHGFLGYYNFSDGQTSCGNCHVGVQAEWEATAHAGAYATLEESDHDAAFCYPCHTVNELGNPLTEAAGWNVVQDTAYHDVQCESCHGPGLTHVENPDAGQPLVSLAVSLPLDQATNGCVECHQGSHHPFAEEWAQSGHATVVTSAAGRPECASCHRGQNALVAWGVNADYLEKNSAEHLPITCGVCHDPHDATYAGQLRRPVETNSIEQHLCAQCHNRRSEPSSASHGLAPHAPEAPLLVGDAGWFPPGALINSGQIFGSHGSEGNPGLCATCHVDRFTVTDAVTGDFVLEATGHLFTALPCLDANGVPTTGSCAITTTARSFNGCVGSGCHTTTQTAFSALTSALIDIEDRASDLLNVLLQVDANLDGAGGEIDDTTPLFTVAEGAFFNFNLANFGAASEGDPPTPESILGGAVHNPFLVRALLVASLQAIQDAYGVTPASIAPGTDWNAELRAILAKAAR